MKLLGFWKEYRGDKLPPLEVETLQKRELPICSNIKKYLENGIWLNKLRTQFDCIITGETIGTPYIYTDGEWFWTTEYIYYIENYEINLPPEFLLTMTKHKYSVLTENELGEDLISSLEKKISFIGY